MHKAKPMKGPNTPTTHAMEETTVCCCICESVFPIGKSKIKAIPNSIHFIPGILFIGNLLLRVKGMRVRVQYGRSRAPAIAQFTHECIVLYFIKKVKLQLAHENLQEIC